MSLKTPEAELKKKIRDILVPYTDPDTGSLWYFMPVASGYTSKAGVPDYVLLSGGIMVTIEAKVPPNKVSPYQKRCMKDLLDKGAIPLVITPENLDRLNYFISEFTLARSEPFDYSKVSFYLKSMASNWQLIYKS